MPKTARSIDLAFPERSTDRSLTVWIYRELCRAIASGKLQPGARLPSTREFAKQHGISRGTAVTVFEQLKSEGYLRTGKGAGTWINPRLAIQKTAAAPVLQTNARYPPDPLVGLQFSYPPRPFRSDVPAVDLFPIREWARITARRLRRDPGFLLAGRDRRGFEPLRTAIASYLGTSRSVACNPDQIFVVSGIQQGLDLVARVLLKPGQSVWMEDPGYFGALLAFRNAGGEVVPIPVDEQGMNPARARGNAKLAYLTPAHQFPLGITMPIQRRLQVLAWARESGCYLLEDDYDSEFRFSSLPVPALQSLDDSERVILVGSFNKLMFPALRIGYIVAPAPLVDALAAQRFGTDLGSFALDQAVMADFIDQGALSRHLRRMREIYGERLGVLHDSCGKYLKGLVELSHMQAGLFTPAFLRNGMTSRQAEETAATRGLESMGLHRFSLRGKDHKGLLLGFGAFDQKSIQQAVISLATVLG
jgi:GntR family transcriptional regulator / MocR family aminotransferase